MLLERDSKKDRPPNKQRRFSFTVKFGKRKRGFYLYVSLGGGSLILLVLLLKLLA